MGTQDDNKCVGIFASIDKVGFLGIGFVTTDPEPGVTLLVEPFFDAPKEEFLKRMEGVRVKLNRLHNDKGD